MSDTIQIEWIELKRMLFVSLMMLFETWVCSLSWFHASTIHVFVDGRITQVCYIYWLTDHLAKLGQETVMWQLRGNSGNNAFTKKKKIIDRQHRYTRIAATISAEIASLAYLSHSSTWNPSRSRTDGCSPSWCCWRIYHLHLWSSFLFRLHPSISNLLHHLARVDT